MAAKRTTKTVTVDLAFTGSGAIIEKPKGVFRGGVPDPELGAAVGFNVLPEEPDEDGHIGPPLNGETYLGALQINLWGDSAGFREIGRYFLALAELDTSADPGFHQHHDVASFDGRTELHLIIRKPKM